MAAISLMNSNRGAALRPDQGRRRDSSGRKGPSDVETSLRPGRAGVDGSTATVSPELLTDLRNLRMLNRYFGSYRLIRHFLRRWIGSGR